MKAKIMALMMAAGLGMTGIAMTAQAAEAEHVHEIVGSYIKYSNAVDHDSMYHIRYNTVHYLCKGCDGYDVLEEAGYELHDYVDVYENGKIIYTYCTGCGVHMSY